MFLNTHPETVFRPSERCLLCISNKLTKRNLLGSFKIENPGFYFSYSYSYSYPYSFIFPTSISEAAWPNFSCFVPVGFHSILYWQFIWHCKDFLWRCKMIKIKLHSLLIALNYLMMLTVFKDRKENNLLVLLFQKRRYGRQYTHKYTHIISEDLHIFYYSYLCCCPSRKWKFPQW